MILKRENKTQGTGAKSVQCFSPQCTFLSCTDNPAHCLGNCSTSLGVVKWKHCSQPKSMVACNHLSPALLKAFHLKASVDHYKGCSVSIADSITVSSSCLAAVVLIIKVKMSIQGFCSSLKLFCSPTETIPRHSDCSDCSDFLIF